MQIHAHTLNIIGLLYVVYIHTHSEYLNCYGCQREELLTGSTRLLLVTLAA